MNHRSVSNIIYKYLFEESSNNNDTLRKILNSCDITPYEIERKDGRIAEQKHNALQMLLNHGPENDDYIIENILQNSISTSYHLFPELTGLCMNQQNLGQAIASFINNSCIIGNCDFFTINSNGAYTKLSYISTSPKPIQKTNSIANIILLSEFIHLYSPNAELDVSLTARTLKKKHLFDEKFNHNCLIDQNENSITIKSSELNKSQNLYNHPLFLLQEAQVAGIKKSIFGSERFSSSVS